jgi:hypothetical protein
MGKGHGRRATAVTACAAAAFALAGCGGGGGDNKAGGGTPSATGTASAQDPAGDTPSATPTPVLAQIKGEPSMVVTISLAVRDQDGFVTVEGDITNDGTSVFDAVAWRGQEVALSKSGASVAGAYLVDEAGKKRYYVLRDTDGRCLCTMGLVGIQPQETRPFFAQFPAPPAATTQVEFELPTMPPAKITLSEG